MDGKKSRFFWQLAAATLIVTVIALSAMMNEAKAPTEAADTPMPSQGESERSSRPAAETEDRVRPGCAVTQTMGFSRCGHSVTRRITAPDSIVGLDFSGVQDYYALWQIEEFAPEAIVMSREIPLFCPMHVVLSADEAGEIVLSQNQYGDGMAVLKSCGVSLVSFDGETGEALRMGLSFDSEADALSWLAAH